MERALTPRPAYMKAIEELFSCEKFCYCNSESLAHFVFCPSELLEKQPDQPESLQALVRQVICQHIVKWSYEKYVAYQNIFRLQLPQSLLKYIEEFHVGDIYGEGKSSIIKIIYTIK